MVTSTMMAIRCDETLGLGNKLTRAMFCSVVARKKLDVFFTTRKAVDVHWEVVIFGSFVLAGTIPLIETTRSRRSGLVHYKIICLVYFGCDFVRSINRPCKNGDCLHRTLHLLFSIK